MPTVKTANLPWTTPRSVDHIGKPRIIETVVATEFTTPSYFESRIADRPIQIGVFPLAPSDTFTVRLQQSVDHGVTWHTVKTFTNTDADLTDVRPNILPGVMLRLFVAAASNAAGVNCQLLQ